MITMIARLDVEIYKEDEQYCVYIGEADSSGWEHKSSTREECAEQVKQYVIDTFYREEDETNRK